MKKTFPIILSSILAITVTSSVAHAATADNYLLFNPSTTNNQPSFSLVGIPSTSTTAATTAKTTTPAKKAAQTTEHKLTWTGTYGKQPLSIKSVQETLKKYEQLPTQKPWNFAGKMVSDAKPIILECVNQYGKNLTIGAFAHCCGTGRTTLAPVQETYGRLTYDPKFCQEMIEAAIKIHNDSVKILATCMPENDKLATAGHYVWVNGVKKCASTHCKDGSYLVKDANGKSQGWCRLGIDPNAQPAENATPVVTPEETATTAEETETPVTTTEETATTTEETATTTEETVTTTEETATTAEETATTTEEAVTTTEETETPVTTTEETVTTTEETEKPATTTEEVATTTEKIENPVTTTEETATTAEKTETPVTTAEKIENTETTLSEKVQNQIKKNENENICLSMGVKSANVAEMNECKKDPDTYKTNKETCDSIKGLSAVEVNQCMKDPKAFAQKHVDEAACESLGLKKGTADFAECKKDPDTYKTNKEACDSIKGLSAVEINQCMKDPKAFAQKRVNKANEESKKKELEDKCDALGAKSGANKKLCMEDPDKYSNAKSQCESMEAKGTNFNKCVTDPAEYRKQYELEKAAKEKGMNVRQYEKYMEEQEQLEAMRKLLG